MNRPLSTLLTLLLTASSIAMAQEDVKVGYDARQYLGNISYGSANPVALNYMPLPDIADIHVAYRHEDGDFHLIDQAASSNLWLVNFSGMKRLGKVTFGGSLVYRNATLNDRAWNNTLFVSANNPFIIGDSIKSKFNPETFHLDGGAAYKVGENLLLGLSANYDVGSSATQKDPRPEIKGMRFRLTPGVEYAFGLHNIGLSGEVEWLSEEVTHTVVRTTTKQYVFLFQGLGVFETKDALGYRRKYNGTHWGAQIQYTFNNSATAPVSNFFQAGYYSEFEDAIDGSSNMKYKGGRYNGTGFSFQDRFMLRVSENTVHNITLNASMSDSKGRWYTQRQSTDANGNLTYEVINESDNLESTYMDFGVGYRYDRLSTSGVPTFQVGAKGIFSNTETKNKIYAAKENYSNALFALDALKRFKVKKGWIGASLNAAYRMNLESKINLNEMPPTYSVIMQNYTRPAFAALTTDFWQAGLSLSYSLPVSVLGYGSLLEIKIDGDYRNRTKTVPGENNDRFTLGAQVGFVF
ncbi:MAG: hypothetical protein K2L34_01105 [Muribaculaceae bacterium]|nr:hypothetical protein [Muribaculaceae bacterium]